MPGHIPAVTTPNKNRNNLRLHASLTAAKHVPVTPTAITMRAIQTRGESLLMTRLEGRSNRT
jgi:hypothetical protein